MSYECVPRAAAGVNRSGCAARRARAPEKHLRRVRRRGVVVEPTALRVDVLDLHHVELAGGDEPHRAVSETRYACRHPSRSDRKTNPELSASQSTDGPGRHLSE